MTAVSKPSPRSTMVNISASEASSSTTKILCLMLSMVSPDRDKTGLPHGRFFSDTPKKPQISLLDGLKGVLGGPGTRQSGRQTPRIDVRVDHQPGPAPARGGQLGV